ncbi:unnamed protein product [Victoria cruziana]
MSSIQKEQVKLLLDVVTTVYIPGFRQLPTRMNRKIWRLHREIASVLRAVMGKREEEMNWELLEMMS